MAKRRLSKNQSRRIKQQQDASLARAQHEVGDIDELSPEERGRVIAHYGTQVEVESSSGEVFRCFLRANLDPIVTGDKVVWQRQKNVGVVVSCETRKSLLCRPDSYGKLKPVAANVDQILITIAPRPTPFTNLIDRYIVIAELNHIRPIILINKSDLVTTANQGKIESIESLYGQLGYDVFTASAKSDTTMDSLREILANKTSIFVGQSGVGKSSIIQRLVPEESILVGELSEAKTKGRHTTTHSRLFRFIDGGECIDSPGIREFGLWHLDKNQVIQGFVELKALAGKCKFRDCTHNEEPGCALVKALTLGHITVDRFESYKRIVASLDDVNIKTQKY